MRIEISIDTAFAGYEVRVDGRKVRIHELQLRLDQEGGSIDLSRLTLGYGNRFSNREDIRLKSAGGAWLP